MKKYTYVVEKYTNVDNLPGYLNNMAKQEWRVISITPSRFFNNMERETSNCASEFLVVYEKEIEN
jgi:hypothetical protein